jgi:hypothetical protein
MMLRCMSPDAARNGHAECVGCRDHPVMSRNTFFIVLNLILLAVVVTAFAFVLFKQGSISWPPLLFRMSVNGKYCCKSLFRVKYENFKDR